jgi:hypothetical protein
MWNYLYGLWRSVLRRVPRDEGDSPAADDSPRQALREELRRLLEERGTLQKAAASYQEFGYDELARRIHEDLVAADRKISAIRLQLRRRQPARGRG